MFSKGICTLLVPFYIFMISKTTTADFSITQSIYNFSVTAFQDCNPGNGNFIMSPLSAQIVLGLTYAGSGGQTAQAMNTALDLNGQTQQQVINDFNSLMTALTQTNGNTTLNIANKIYLSDSYQLSSAYESVAAQFFSAVQTINFNDNIDASNAINAWASQETDGNIPTVVNPGDFDAQTVMVLLNAIYFKGFWINQFDPSRTQPSSFYPSTTTIQQIPFMNIETQFNYGYISSLQASALQMMYTDPTLSMLFILPNQRNGLTAMIGNLGSTNINSIMNSMYNTDVIVSIPKFTIRSNFNLDDALMKMGMGIIFGRSANFSGMVKHVPAGEVLAVSAVTQNAFIEVDENGAKAAAVTVVRIEALDDDINFSPPQTPTFIADHPFLFIILKNNNPLFVGTFIQGDGAVTAISNTPTISIPTSNSGISMAAPFSFMANGVLY